MVTVINKIKTIPNDSFQILDGSTKTTSFYKFFLPDDSISEMFKSWHGLKYLIIELAYRLIYRFFLKSVIIYGVITL